MVVNIDTVDVTCFTEMLRKVSPHNTNTMVQYKFRNTRILISCSGYIFHGYFLRVLRLKYLIT